MNSHELAEKLGELIRQERKISNEVLSLINFALEKRSYLDLGFASMFDWLVKGFGFSNAAAYRRIEAAKLLRAVPEATEKLVSGEVNLSTLCKAQSLIRVQEKALGRQVAQEVKKEIVDKIENKSTQEAEQVLISILPEAASSVHQDRRRVIDESTTRLSVNLSNESTKNLNRAKEILSHKFPKASDAEIIAYSLKYLLDRIDPLRKSTSAAEAKRVTKAGVRRNVIKLSQASCTYRDPKSGKVCGSRYQVQIDHVLPKAFGGGDEQNNLRTLCRQHNLLMAERSLGKEKMDRYRSPKS